MAKRQNESSTWVREQQLASPPRASTVVPFVRESVFLQREQFVCDLCTGGELEAHRIDGSERKSTLMGMSELLELADARQRIYEPVFTQLLARSVLHQRREGEAGFWIIEEQPLDARLAGVAGAPPRQTYSAWPDPVPCAAAGVSSGEQRR